MGKLYEQALLDAREIRATALANAKIALEEAFQPNLERMISDKIHMDLEGEQSPEEPVEEPVAEPTGDEFGGEEPAMAEPVAGDEGEEGGIEGASDDLDIETEPTEVPGEEGEEDLLETGAGTDVTSGAGANTEGHGGKSFKTAAPYDKKAKTVLEGEEDTLDLESIIRELEDEADEDDEDVEESKKEEDVEESTKVTSDADQNREGHHGGNENAPYTACSKSISESEEDGEEEIDLDEILRELGSEEEVPSEFTPNSEDELTGGDEELQAENGRLQNDLHAVQSDLAEHRKVLSLLKSRLTEVNLLNAKLLYTNRLFKGYSLNNSQKMKVVENFDRAKNIREVKLVYTTIAESLSQTDLSKKSRKIVSKITEGIASKTQKSTKPVAKKSSIIDDGSAERLQKLAGIIK